MPCASTTAVVRSSIAIFTAAADLNADFIFGQKQKKMQFFCDENRLSKVWSGIFEKVEIFL